MLYALQMCISNQYALNRLVGYHVNFKTAVLLPLVASILMGACAYGSYSCKNRYLALLPLE